MLYLILWMHVANQNTMTAISLPISTLCAPVREAATHEAGVTHAMCAGDPMTLNKYVKADGCVLFDESEQALFFTCVNGAWHPVNK